MTSTGKFVYMAHHFILLQLNPFGAWVDSEGWWFEHSMSYLRICLSAEDAKHVSWRWLSPRKGWRSLTMTTTGKFVYMTHHFILLRLNPFDLRFDSEGWWFGYSMSQLRVFLSVEGAKNLFWCWPSTLRGWGSLNMTFTVEFLCMAH